MAAFGYTLSSEESGARELVAHAARAEEVGFSFAVISDHFHPWVDRQGTAHVYLHQVGPDQDGFFEAYGREILPPAERGLSD